MSTEFKWENKDFDLMYASCAHDDAVAVTIDNIPSKKARILEAGSGTGRVVKYLYDLGYRNVEGIELNKAAVKHFNQKFPQIKVIQGDILDMPYRDNTFDVIASYGVVEHFKPGLEAPLKALKRVLKKDGVLIVSVPSMNFIRRFIYAWDLFVDKLFFWKKSMRNKGIYYIHPQFGDFFEYRLTPSEFRKACILAGYEIVQDFPIYHMDGLFHIFGNSLTKYQNYKFYPNFFGKIINNFLLMFPFVHNHMHMIVLKKSN
jgi:SAM-dependent methyltransferase